MRLRGSRKTQNIKLQTHIRTMSQITTHILDTSKGKPVNGVKVYLYKAEKDDWTQIAWGTTNEDGRVRELLPTDDPLPRGNYKLKFEIKDYFDKEWIPTFYPFVEIVFEIQSADHYHIPLLLNPFGYSTYRGS